MNNSYQTTGIQSRLAQASFSLDDASSSLLLATSNTSDPYEYIIATLRRLHNLPPSPYQYRENLEDCLTSNSFHYRPSEILSGKSGFDQVPVIAITNPDNELVILSRYRHNILQYSSTNSTPTVVPPDSINTLFYPSVYEIYPVFPPGSLTLLGLFRFVFPSISRELLRAGLISFLLIIFSLASPVITAHVVGDVVPSGDISWIQSTFIISVLLAIYQSSFSYLQSFYFMRLNQKLRLRLQIPLFARILSYPIEFLDKYSVGDISSRASSVSTVITALSASTLSSLIGSLSLVGYTVLMFYYDSTLSLWALLVVSVSLSFEVYFSRRQLAIQKTLLEEQSDMYEQTLQILGALPQIRSNAAEPFILLHWYRRLVDLTTNTFKSQRLGDLASTVSSVVNIAGTTTIYIVLVSRLLSSATLEQASVSTTTFIVFTGAFSGFASRAASLISLFNSLLGSVWVQWKRALPLMHQAEEPGLLGVKQRVSLSGAIRFADVSFAYPSSPDEYVFEKLTFSIKPRKFNVIFGPSGCGKSTIISLLLGFYKASRGSIFFDDISIDDLDIRYVRQQLGTILQQPTLPPGSVRDAITSGLVIDEDRIWSALQKVNLLEEISSLPMKLETVLSEGASNISGGQKQRLCIARALLNDPVLLLEDEATSALDTRSQSIVTNSLRQEGITRIVVAHRLSAVSSCDHMIVINKGQVECEGTYEYCAEHSDFLRQTIAVNHHSTL